MEFAWLIVSSQWVTEVWIPLEWQDSEVQGACPWQAGWAQWVPCHWCRLKYNFDNLNKTSVAKQRLNMCTRALPLGRHGRAKWVLWDKCRSKYNIEDSDERSTPELRWELCTKTGIKHEYQNWDQACVPGGPGGVPPAGCDRHWRHGQAREVCAIGVGLKLVYIQDMHSHLLLHNSSYNHGQSACGQVSRRSDILQFIICRQVWYIFFKKKKEKIFQISSSWHQQQHSGNEVTALFISMRNRVCKNSATWAILTHAVMMPVLRQRLTLTSLPAIPLLTHIAYKETYT